MTTCIQDTPISKKRLQELTDKAVGWAVLNGMTFRSGDGEEAGTAVCVPFALFPSVVPAEVMKQAKSTTTHFSRLMHSVAMDHDFLTDCFRTLIEVDSFTAGLWDIYLKVREAGSKQPIMLCLFRNDFMMDCKETIPSGQIAKAEQLRLTQIEFNSIAVGAGGIMEQLGKQHRLTLDLCGKEYTDSEMPDNTPATCFAAALIRGWQLYGNPESVIIMIVDDAERFGTDQNWIELRIIEQNPRVRILRKVFSDLVAEATLDNQSRLIVNGDEVGLIYWRHGYSEDHYPSNKEWSLRLMLEMSTAVKCPCIQHHLVTSKKVQQKLAQPGVLERFIKDPDVVDDLRDTFGEHYSLDLGAEGDRAVRLALASPDKYVLKPSREAGGNNLFDEDITDFLSQHGQSKQRSAYVLMQKVFPWQQKNYLYKQGAPLLFSDVVTELGIYGAIIGSSDKEMENYECGYLMRTKVPGTKEGSMEHGTAYLDTPFIC